MVLEVRDLRVTFDTHDGALTAVDGLSFDIAAGRTLGIAGESGSGKTQTAMAIMGLLPANGSASGSVCLDGTELLGLPERDLNRVRGSGVAMVFQDPMTSLNPYLRIGTQMTEVLTVHRGMSARAARARAAEMLEAVHLPDAARCMKSYPHALSGGMRQRVLIAMALTCEPALLIADEPTTALDVTVQAQILSLLTELRERFGMAVLLITHDLGVIAGTCDEVLVMYGGQLMERAGVIELFGAPRHPYTRGLMRALPGEAEAGKPLAAIPGQPPDLAALPAGCPFSARCPEVLAMCAQERPAAHRTGPAHHSACHLESAS